MLVMLQRKGLREYKSPRTTKCFIVLLEKPCICFFKFVRVGSLLLRAEEKGAAAVVKQVSWYQVNIFFLFFFFFVTN